MTILQPLFFVVVFVIAALVCYAILWQLLPTALEKRVEALAEGSVAAAPKPGIAASTSRVLSRWLAAFARPSLPKEAWEKSPLRLRFYNAGFRTTTAPITYFGAKTVLTFVLPVVLLLSVGATGVHLEATPLLASLVLLAGVGYYLPNVVLAHIISRRQRGLFEAFPDALDLMRVCVEAGLGMDAAIERVGREMALESRALSEEFHLVSLELRAGASRADALRNLALRVALEDIDAMVATLVQADRFGTSVAESLRVHSETLRTKRRLIAEEAAAKLPVKLLVPLIFCVFPALLTVLLGPAAISVYRILLPRITGQ